MNQNWIIKAKLNSRFTVTEFTCNKVKQMVNNPFFSLFLLNVLFKVIFIVLFFVSTSLLARPVGVIKGVVKERGSEVPLVGANVVVIGTKLGGATDTTGYFTILNVPVGSYSLQASMLGYVPIVKTDVIVATGRATWVEFQLEESPITLKEMVVQAEYFAKDVASPTSKQNLSYEEIRRSPGAAGDISRMVQNLPGVNFVSDARNDLVVRGGSPAENLNLYDGIEIPNTNHFGTQGATGGAITMVQSEFIREVNFYTGAFPSKYGNKLSSVLDIHLRNGSQDEFLGSFDLSMSGAGLIFEGPLFNGSYLFNARRSYLDLIMGQIGLAALPTYSDCQGKIVQRFGKNHRLSILGIGGIDHIEFKPGEDEEYGGDGIELDQNQFVLGAKLHSLWKKDLFTEGIISYASNLYDVYVEDTLNTRLYENKSEERKTTFRVDVLFKNLSFGAYLNGVEFTHKIYLKGGGRFEGIDLNAREDSYKLGGYFQSEWRIRKACGALGFHYHYFDYTGCHSVGPRGSISYDLTHYLAVNLGYGIFYQNPSYIWLSVYPENKELKDIRAEHYVLGLSLTPGNGIKTSIEGFYKYYSHYPVDLNDSTRSLANEGDIYGMGSFGRFISKGVGVARGVELLFQKKLINKVYTIFSYTYSRVMHSALDGIKRPGSYDTPHVLNLILGYKPTHSLEFSLKWRYASGRPYTLIDTLSSKEQGFVVFDKTKVNALRYPYYSRLDFRFDKRHYFKGWNIVWYLDLQNLFDRHNIWFHYWNAKKEKVESSYQWARIIVGGVKIEF